MDLTFTFQKYCLKKGVTPWPLLEMQFTVDLTDLCKMPCPNQITAVS